MGAFSLSHILVVAVLAVLLFGRGKVSELMGDLGRGIRSFKKSMAEDEAPTPPARVGNRAEAPAKLASAATARDA
jgi:sec-independent protein translocase protein TatA